jgi:hypothetical protein
MSSTWYSTTLTPCHRHVQTRFWGRCALGTVTSLQFELRHCGVRRTSALRTPGQCETGPTWISKTLRVWCRYMVIREKAKDRIGRVFVGVYVLLRQLCTEGACSICQLQLCFGFFSRIELSVGLDLERSRTNVVAGHQLLSAGEWLESSRAAVYMQQIAACWCEPAAVHDNADQA